MEILIAGAGGITNTMISTLCKIIKDDDSLTIMDGDTFEEKNAARQVFCVPGRQKADVIAEECERLGVMDVTSMPRYIRDKGDLEGYDLIISCVDNNDTRLIMKNYCDEERVFMIIGANEDDLGNAFVYHPSIPEKWSPFTRYENLNEPDGLHPGNSCTSLEHVLENEQTPWANHVAGTGILSLFIDWRDYIEGDSTDINYRPIELTYMTHTLKSFRIEPDES